MVEIKRVTSDDLGWLQEHRNRDDLILYFNQYRELSKEDMVDWYHDLTEPDSHFHAFIVWIGDRRIGYAALKDINNILHSAEFSIFIISEERNKGFGTIALNLLLDYGFNTLNLEVIHSIVFEFNRAIEIYKQVGFKVDGLLRHTCYKQGKYHRSYYISMLKNEYTNSIQ